MEHKGEKEDRIIKLNVPERSWDGADLLQNPDHYAIESIHSLYHTRRKTRSFMGGFFGAYDKSTPSGAFLGEHF
jgi:hypothetical protein